MGLYWGRYDMQVGCLGDIIFEVSDSVVKTLFDVVWSGSVTIQTHKIHLDNALQEFVSIDPDGFTFSVKLAYYLGVKPMDDIIKIFDYERSATALPLTLGTKSYGKAYWLIKNHKVKAETYDKDGDIASAIVSLTLTEYI
jgi:hypothetical protein